ncbi:hypothetical protein [Variovorax sp. LT1R16]|uniref:hypothetical protein n=1 Tax=Variovorax sp. LT1R16 TaxID=3443728 RepID=UPI003F46B5B9
MKSRREPIARDVAGTAAAQRAVDEDMDDAGRLGRWGIIEFNLVIDSIALQ